MAAAAKPPAAKPDPKQTEQTGTTPEPAQAPQTALKAVRRVNPRAADELPPGLPHGFDQDGPRKKYRVHAAFVLDDDGMEVAHGGIVELSDKLAARYEEVSTGYGDRTRLLVSEYKEPEAEDESEEDGEG